MFTPRVSALGNLEKEGMVGMEVNGGMEEENGITEVPVEFDSNNDDDDDEMMMPPVQVEVEMNNEEDDGDKDEQN